MKTNCLPSPISLCYEHAQFQIKYLYGGSRTERSKPQIPELEKGQKAGFENYVLRTKKRRKFTGK